MKKLYLIRHAKSSWAEPGLRDHDRPLAARGRRQLDVMRPVIEAGGAFDGPIFCSTAKRARQTLKGLLSSSVRPDIEFDPALYTFDYRDLLDWLAPQQEPVITLVGHNPAFEDLAGHLLAEAPGHVPTCGFLHIELAVDDWQSLDDQPGRLLQFATPKKVAKRG